MLEYVCSLKLKSGQVEHTATRKYSIQASVLMFLVDQHTQLKCVFKDLEIESGKKNPMYISVKSPLFRQTCGMCGQSTMGGFWGPLGSESRSGQKYNFFKFCLLNCLVNCAFCPHCLHLESWSPLKVVFGTDLSVNWR